MNTKSDLKPNLIGNFLLATRKNTVQTVERFGNFILYFGEICRIMFRRPYRFSMIIQQMDFIGTQSFFIIVLTGFFTGAVFGLQTGGVFAIFQAENMVGGATALALSKELAPLIGSFLLTGRAGSAITAEIATMVVNEQVDALEVMAVDPLHYLVVPRMWAAMLMMPLLCGIFMFVGIFGTVLVGITIYQVDVGIFWDKLLNLVTHKDLISGLRKMFIFSVIIASIHCYFGLKATGGAKGVGVATTKAVVTTLTTLLATDFIISYLEIIWSKS